MDGKGMIYLLFSQYFFCYTGTMFATMFFCAATGSTEDLPVSYLWQAALFSVFADLPCVVYYSKTELTKKQWWQRTAIHTLLLEVVLLTAGHLLDMYRGIAGMLLFVVTILMVDLFVRGVSYALDFLTALRINNYLRNRRNER